MISKELKINNDKYVSLETMIYDYHNSNKFPLDKRDELINELILERDHLYKLLEELSDHDQVTDEED